MNHVSRQVLHAPDPYKALGVEESAPLAVIKSAYRKLILVCHPDRNTSIDEATKQAASETFHRVQQAYFILSDERERERYDNKVKLAELRAQRNEERLYDNKLKLAALRAQRNEEEKLRKEVEKAGKAKERQQRNFIRKHIPDRIEHRLKGSETKRKQGLAGFANNSRTSAVADTGSQKNVISASYAARLGLTIENLPSSFTLGNSRKLNSIGTVSLRWSFAESPEKAVPIICHVLPRCIYDLILGNGFLTATETMSRFRHRLTSCLFPVASKHATFAFLGETCQRLQGVLADEYDVLAVPDSGAERNVMDMQFAINRGFKIKKETEHRNWLQFADGSCAYTIGQVDTYWTFATGERVPVTFEILENCCSDVVIGDEILTHHNVFDFHASSLISLDASPDSYELAPFDFINRWPRRLGLRRGGAPKDGQNQTLDPHVEERRRRDMWNFEHKYGANATTIEKDLEMARRTRYDSSTTAARRPVVPSIPTAPSGR
ncbi:hypothetical protein G7Y79_00038g075090 [Physcia stellaris]|nr:hypothetical protein G7Y79_00038g075090 [Physcia stellaris]